MNGQGYYPLFLNVKNKKCVIVGGGQVALRKAKALLDFGAEVLVVSPDLCPDLSTLAKTGAINTLHREYIKGDLSGAVIIIAATDSEEVNSQVSEDARQERIPVNVVDDAAISDFIAPAYFRRGDITIAISSSGKSPALARKIRTRLEKEYGSDYAELAALLDEIRTEIKQSGIHLDGDSWQEAIDLDLMLDLLSKGERAKAKQNLRDSLNNLTRKAKINE
jgi:precorrin-2 dehydrogenase / sirohydrochlorin ferrochelatase